MIVEVFRAMRQLKQVRKELQQVSSEHSETTRRIITTADEISRGKRRTDERVLDELVRRRRATGMI